MGFYKTFEEYVLNVAPNFLPVQIRVEDEIYLDIVINTEKKTFVVNGNYVREINLPPIY